MKTDTQKEMCSGWHIVTCPGELHWRDWNFWDMTERERGNTKRWFRNRENVVHLLAKKHKWCGKEEKRNIPVSPTIACSDLSKAGESHGQEGRTCFSQDLS